MKIFISGPSGIGKTTMAHHLSEKLEIPFIQGSSKVLWEKHNISSHVDLIQKCDADIEFAKGFQEELLIYRNESTKDLDAFVTDRSPLDNLAYFLLQLSHKVDADYTLSYIAECMKSYPEKYLQCYFGFNYSMAHEGIENDGFRITNMYYQLMVDNIFNMLLNNNWLDLKPEMIIRFTTWDFKAKSHFINKHLKKLYA